MTCYYNDSDPRHLFTAYLVTNTLNGKRYIGITGKTPNERWIEHVRKAHEGKGKGSALHCAIRKYGFSAFVIQAVSCAQTWDAICTCEKELIVQWGTRAPVGYNVTSGGDGVVGLPPHIRQRISAKNRGFRHTPEARRKIAQAGRGRHHSPESLTRLRSAHLGKKLTAEHRQKLSLAKVGKKLPPRSVEHCTRISEGLRRAHARRKATAQ